MNDSKGIYEDKSDSILDDADRVKTIRDRWKLSKDGLVDWRIEAKESFAFRAGDQWAQNDLDKLKTQNRPAVTFNRVGAMVDAVHGIEVNNRQEIRFYPREEGDAQVNEQLTSTAKWMRDNCYAEDEESEAFEDAVISGIGCTETRMDYEEDSDGKVIIERKDPLHMFWDPDAKKKCLEDARWVFNAEWMPKDEVKEKWPDKADDLIAGDDLLDKDQPHNADRAFLYEDDQESEERRKNELLVLHYQCWKLETFYRVLDPFTQKVTSLKKSEFDSLGEKIKMLGMEFVKASDYIRVPSQIPYVKQKKRVYYRAFLVGATLLEYEKSPSQEGFTFRFITGRRDRNKNMWYGIVRAMKDPQRWGNKWLSQVLDIVASNTKGGAFVEEGALVDKRKAEEQWASHSPLIQLTEGGINKIKERTPAPYPTGIDRLMTFAFDALPFVSGLNLEVMGLADRAQAGVLESQRRQAAISLLAPLFDALRRYRKSQGHLLLEYIKNFFSEGRLTRIVGPTGEPRYISMMKQDDTVEYDVIVDQAPSSPDYKERVWTALKELLPVMMKQGYPLPPAVFEYTPLPTHVAVQMKAYAEGFVPPAIQQQMQQMQEQMQSMQQENSEYEQTVKELQADRSADFAKVKAKLVDISERRQAKREAMMAGLAMAKMTQDTQKTEGVMERGLKAAIAEHTRDNKGNQNG